MRSWCHSIAVLAIVLTPVLAAAGVGAQEDAGTPVDDVREVAPASDAGVAVEAGVDVDGGVDVPEAAESTDTSAAEAEGAESASDVDVELTPEELELLGAAAAADASASGTSPDVSTEPLPEALQDTPASNAGGGQAANAALQAALSALSTMNPHMAFILDAGFAAFSDDKRLRQTGAHDLNKNGFGLQQLELNIGASVDPFARFDANLVFSQFGVELEEAYGTTLSLPWGLQARGGQFLQRFGRKNPTHPHSWSFVDQPLVNGKFFGSEGSRGLGAELSWLTPLPWYAEVVVSVHDAAGACCARSFLGAAPTKNVLDISTLASLKQFFAVNDDLALVVGLSGLVGPNTAGRMTRSEIYGADLYLRYRPITDPNRTTFTLTVEGMHRRRQTAGDVLTDSGMYAEAALQFLLQYEVAARVEWVQGAGSWNQFLQDPTSPHVDVVDPLDPDWTHDAVRTSVAATYMPTHFSRVRLQGAMTLPGRDVPAIGLDPKQAGTPVYSAFVSFEVLVGEHPAHRY